MLPRRFGFLGVLATLLLVLLAGGVGFALGAATNGPPGVHYGYWPAWGFGFGYFGLLFPILFFVLIFSAIRGVGRGWDGHDGGRSGRGYSGRPWQGDVPPTVAEWHRHLHEEGSTQRGQGQAQAGGPFGGAPVGGAPSGGAPGGPGPGTTGPGATGPGSTGSGQRTF